MVWLRRSLETAVTTSKAPAQSLFTGTKTGHRYVHSQNPFTLLTLQVVHNGKLSAMFDQADKINLLSFETQEHQQYLPRLQLDSLFQQRSPQQNMQVSPKMSKKNAPNQRNQRARGEPVLLLSELIEAPVSSWGIANSVLQFLEVRQPVRF